MAALNRDYLRTVRAITAGEEMLLRFTRGAVEVTLPGHTTQSADLGAQVRVRTSALGGYIGAPMHSPAWRSPKEKH